MWKYSLPLRATRTPGYVFWRQNTLLPIENVKRNYLQSEQQVPVAEVARRMVRVKSSYESTQDYHERTLLRGEYKYFSGKVCDLRGSQPRDCIAFLQCCAFFGFWDTAQVERMLLELHRGKDALTPNELVCLFVSLPPLRKQQTDLYQAIARLLVDVVDELTLEECLQVCAACSAEVPPVLLQRLLAAMLPALADLTPSQLVVEVLDPLSAAPAPVEAALEQLYDAVLPPVVQRLDELQEGMELAILYTILRGKPAYCTPGTERKVLDAFIALREYSCARSTAMMFTAVSEAPHALLLHFARAMERRVLFLSTDFSTEEFMDVFHVYVNSYTSMLALQQSMQPAPGTAAAAAEWQVALQQEASLRHTVTELSEQLVLLLESASSYLSRAQLLELLQLYATMVEDLCALSATASADVASSAEAEKEVREKLKQLFLTKLPQTRAIMRVVSAKCITELPNMTLKELLALLQGADVLGPAFVQDAAVGGALHELTRRQMRLDVGQVESLSKLLVSFTGLRSGHQKKIHENLLPQLYKRFSADA